MVGACGSWFGGWGQDRTETEVYDPPGKRGVFSRGEAEGFHNLDCLNIKIRIPGGLGGQDVCDSAIRPYSYKK